jgi:chemotaxis protein MotB
MAKKGEAHHGGAWKVAYADFVTAMMALFMVLWISAQDKQILLATSEYFKQPFNALTDKSIGVMRGKDGGSRGKDKTGETATAANLAFLNALAKELNRMLNVSDTDTDNSVDVAVTSDGLRVNVFDRPKRPIFDKNKATFTPWGDFVMQNLAWIVDRNRFRATIDGHAATGTQLPDPDYGIFDLTTDRANAARRLLEKYAVDPSKIARVAGYGDTQPLPNVAPNDEANARITVSLSLDNSGPQKPANNAFMESYE